MNRTLFLALPLLLLPALASGEEGFTVAVTGDLLLGRGVAERAARDGWSGVLAPLRETLAGVDTTIANLESPFGTCLPGGTVQRPRLCGDSRAATELRRWGIAAVTLANNHSLDAGEQGLADTIARLHEGGVAVLGGEAARTGKPAVERFGPIQVLAVNLSKPAWRPGRDQPIPSQADLAAVVRVARAQTPHVPVLVVLHGGREMDVTTSGFETKYATPLVAAGAAAVVFHGAHVVHPLTTIDGVPVHLGLGNLLFDQHNPLTTRGEVLVLRFRPDRAAEVVDVRCVETATGRRRDCMRSPH